MRGVHGISGINKAATPNPCHWVCRRDASAGAYHVGARRRPRHFAPGNDARHQQ
ncbi:hypothetical protein BKA56DRAFT_575878 [Ilyonectria sp. MPI-CAGE-AT-0026]|nr:hypothetical protein BKA56DRAFT_575878 [Ilyonectria sp. MPI-CAGE-AT-0026]